MEIKVLPLGDIAVNCYLLNSENAAVVIDPGFASPKINEFIEENANKEILILLTHGHFDHIGAVADLKGKYGVKVAIGQLDAPAITDGNLNLSGLFGMPIKTFSADLLICDGDEFSVGDINFKAIHTPGHTVGGTCYLVGNVLFSGDTLFNGSIGRTDFPKGDFSVLLSSIKNKLFVLPDDTQVLSGHGSETNIGLEKRFNPFIKW